MGNNFLVDKKEFKDRRERLGYTQAKLAELLNISISIISKYETGANDVPSYFEFIFEALEYRKIEALKTQVEKK